MKPHVMQSGFYTGKDISAIPTADVAEFARKAVHTPEVLTLAGWSELDIAAIIREARRRRRRGVRV